MPERLVAMHRGVHDDAKRHDVRDLFQGHRLLALHLGPDGMRALAPARDLGLEAGLLKRLRQGLDDPFDLAAALPLEQLESLCDILVGLGLEHGEGPVRQVFFPVLHPDPLGERHVDFQRLGRDLAPFLFPGDEMQRAHVVAAGPRA